MLPVMLGLVLLGAGQIPVPVEPVQSAACVPPGLPPLATWREIPPVGMFVTQIDEKPYVITTRRYRLETNILVQTWWIGVYLLSVDPDALNREALLWHRRGMVRPDGRALLSAVPVGCDWFREGS